MNENSASATLTSEQISGITRQNNYGTWRFQKTWNRCTSPMQKAAGSLTARASDTSTSARSSCASTWATRIRASLRPSPSRPASWLTSPGYATARARA